MASREADMNNSSEPNPATTDYLIKKLRYSSKKSTFTWRGSFDELKIFCFEHLEMDSTTCLITQNEQRKSIKAKSLTVSYFKTGTLQLQGNNAQSAKDKLRAALDGGQTNCDLDDESLDVASERHVVVENDKPQADTSEFSESFSNETDDFIKPISLIQDQELYSFIETKVREVCRREVEKLKSEASSSYANETISLLQKENDTLKQRLQELESRHANMKLEATTLIDENKSWMTAIRLLNNELQTVLKADDVNSSQPNERDEKEWQVAGAKKNKEKNKTRERNPEKNVKELQSGLGNNAQTRKPVTVIAGDSIIQNIRGWNLSKTNKVVVKPFPGATAEDMQDFIKPILRKDPENIIIHVGTNDVNSKEPRLTAEAIVNLARQIEGDAPNTNIAISGLVSRADDREGKVSSVNKLLKKFCRQNEWNFIEHNNVNLTHLNRGGLHLSKSGTALVAENFCKYID